ncbi:MAG: sulfotransferase domain-containing protein [Cyanobacteria bacterium P01_D01_bin.123]
MIVWLASYPRSGNTFFRMLLHYQCGVNTYSVYADPDITGMGAAGAVGHEILPAPIEELAECDELYFVKTHERPGKDDYPAIQLIRDGRDSLVSHARYLLKFYWETDDPIRRFKQFVGFENYSRTLRNVILTSGWSDHLMDWGKRRSRGQTFTLRYEDLVDDPDLWLSRALHSLDLRQLTTDVGEIPSFEDLQKQWPQFFRKGKVGAWQEEMSPKLQELFWKHHGEAMHAFGYS